MSVMYGCESRSSHNDSRFQEQGLSVTCRQKARFRRITTRRGVAPMPFDVRTNSPHTDSYAGQDRWPAESVMLDKRR